MTPRPRRAAAVGLAVLPLLSASLSAAIPLQQTAAITANKRGIETKMEHIESQLSQREHLLARTHEMKTSYSAELHLLHEDTPTVSAAILSTMLNDILSRSGGYMTSVQILEPTLRGPLRRIGVRLRAELDIVSLRDFLYEVENHSLLLEVTRLSLHSAVSGDPPWLIRADITIIGYGRLTG
jgi:hypothetical protein